MEINNKNRKELINIFRSKVEKGQHAYRTTLLAYAFLREVPYIKLERIVNEDKLPNDSAKCFIVTLAADVARELVAKAFGYEQFCDAFFKVNGEYPDTKDIRSAASEYMIIIRSWMLEKYENQEEAAA